MAPRPYRCPKISASDFSRSGPPHCGEWRGEAPSLVPATRRAGNKRAVLLRLANGRGPFRAPSVHRGPHSFENCCLDAETLDLKACAHFKPDPGMDKRGTFKPWVDAKIPVYELLFFKTRCRRRKLHPKAQVMLMG